MIRAIDHPLLQPPSTHATAIQHRRHAPASIYEDGRAAEEGRTKRTA